MSNSKEPIFRAKTTLSPSRFGSYHFRQQKNVAQEASALRQVVCQLFENSHSSSKRCGGDINMTEKLIDCGTRRKFSWKHPEKRKSELPTPTKCMDCNEEQLQRCIEKSWIEQGKDPKALRITNLLMNQNPEADQKAVNCVRPTSYRWRKIQSKGLCLLTFCSECNTPCEHKTVQKSGF